MDSFENAINMSGPQGIRFRLILCLGDEAFEIVVVEVCLFASDFEAVFIVWISDEVHGDMFDEGHVVGSGGGSQSGEVVVEDDVEHPMQPIGDAVRYGLFPLRCIEKWVSLALPRR